MSAQEPDIEKKKKRRRRSARVYLSNAHPLPTPEQLAALVDQFPSDEDDDDQAKKGTMGNPHVTPGRGSLVSERLSGPLTEGRQAPAVDDHCVGAGRSAELAWQHPSMRMATTNPVPLFSARTEADVFPRDLNGMSNGIPVALSRLDAYSAAGAPAFGQQPSGNPMMRQMPHIAPTGSGSNGGHSLTDPQSHAVALKASDRVEIMRRAMYGPRSGPR